MPYEGTDHSWIKRAGGLGATIVVILVVGALARGGTREAIDYARTSPMAVESELESAFSKDPALQRMFSTLKRHYPEAYGRYIDEVSISMRQGASQADLNRQSFNFMRSFTFGLRDDFVAAPERNLFAVRDATSKLENVLASESSSLCAQFAMDGLQQGVSLSDDAKASLAMVSALTIEAAAAGRERPTSRGPATEGDWEELLRGMLESGTPESDLNHLIDGTYSSLSDERQCALGRSFYEALAAIPEDPSARLSAQLLIPANQ